MNTAASRHAAMADRLATAFAHLSTIPLAAAPRLIAILEAAPTEALRLLYNRRVKFCWTIAGRILRDRGEPQMMPGQTPYNPAEIETLRRLVSDAAAGDPGEQAEVEHRAYPTT